eukprot:5011571-Alexandrium_andersonii.AAC.1
MPGDKRWRSSKSNDSLALHLQLCNCNAPALAPVRVPSPTPQGLNPHHIFARFLRNHVRVSDRQ